MITRKQKDEMLASFPWIKRLKTPVPCEAIKWGKVALKNLYSWGPKRTYEPIGLEDPKYHCKNRARWHYTPLKTNWHVNTPMNCCMSHLLQQMYGSMEEDTRNNKWWEKHRDRVLTELGIPLEGEE